MVPTTSDAETRKEKDEKWLRAMLDALTENDREVGPALKRFVKDEIVRVCLKGI